MNSRQLDRRTFLQGVGVTISLDDGYGLCIAHYRAPRPPAQLILELAFCQPQAAVEARAGYGSLNSNLNDQSKVNDSPELLRTIRNRFSTCWLNFRIARLSTAMRVVTAPKTPALTSAPSVPRVSPCHHMKSALSARTSIAGDAPPPTLRIAAAMSRPPEEPGARGRQVSVPMHRTRVCPRKDKRPDFASI